MIFKLNESTGKSFSSKKPELSDNVDLINLFSLMENKDSVADLTISLFDLSLITPSIFPFCANKQSPDIDVNTIDSIILFIKT